MRSSEQIQTEMMSEMLRVKAKKNKELKIFLGNQKKIVKEEKKVKTPTPSRDPSETITTIVGLLEENHNDEELIKSMDLLIPLVLGMFTTSPHWLVRDKALESLRLIHRKMGKPMIDKHMGSVSKCYRTLLEQLLSG